MTGEVVPSAKDGLHCGTLTPTCWPARFMVVPSAKDGLHCGCTSIRLAESRHAGSSRPPRTGSIAARGQRGARCRRPVVVPSAKDGLHCGVVQEKEPPYLVSVVPSAKDGLHCGDVGARDGRGGSGPSSRPPRTGSIAACPATCMPHSSHPVVPSAKDGLHCGALRQGRAAGLDPSSRPPRTGSIAAGMLAGSRPLSPVVVPSAKDGLHCGSRWHRHRA